MGKNLHVLECLDCAVGSIIQAPDEIAECFASPEFDDLLVRTIVEDFPPHEHEPFIERYRSMLEGASPRPASDG